MNALLRKELRQTALARPLVAFALAFGVTLAVVLKPGLVLLPGEYDVALQYLTFAAIAVLEGLLVGFVQLGRERWAGTEAYLVHRATGRRDAFVAKLIAGLCALALLVVVPPLVYALWHLAIARSVVDPLPGRLVHLVVASACGLPAYAVGLISAQLRKAWGARALFAMLAGATVLLVAAASSQPPPDAPQTSIAAYLTVQAVLGALLLAVAYRMFLAGEDEEHPWPGRVGLAVGAAALVLFWGPWAIGVAVAQQVARAQLLATYPQVIEDADGRLYVASELERAAPGTAVRRAGRAFELRDAQGRVVEPERARQYDGFGFAFDPFLTLFDPSSTPLSWDHPWADLEVGLDAAGPFGFDGKWIALDSHRAEGKRVWFRPADGSVHVAYTLFEWSGWRAPFAHEVLERPDGRAFSERTVVVHPSPVHAGVETGGAALVDLEDRTLWTTSRTGEPPWLRIERLQLPDDDALVGLVRLQSLFRLRAGLYEPFGVSTGLLLLGERGRYLWSGRAFTTLLDGEPTAEQLGWRGIAEDRADDAIAWRLQPSQVDGLGFRIEVRDARSGVTALAHDFRPTTSTQERWAALAWITTLARPPVGSLLSFFVVEPEPRDAARTAGADVFLDPLLLGGRHLPLLALHSALGLLLAWLTHRRLGRDPRERAVRWLWTLAVLALGLLVWVLCGILEPMRALRTADRSAQRPEPALLIRTA